VLALKTDIWRAETGHIRGVPLCVWHLLLLHIALLLSCHMAMIADQWSLLCGTQYKYLESIYMHMSIHKCVYLGMFSIHFRGL